MGDPKPCGRGVAPCSAASAVDATARAFHVIDTDLKPWEIAIVEVGVRWSQNVIKSQLLQVLMGSHGEPINKC